MPGSPIAATRFPDVTRCPSEMKPYDRPTACDRSAKPPRMRRSQERPASRTPQGGPPMSKKITRRAFAASSAAAAAVAGFGFKPALAQAYPARPVTVIVPWGAGGGTDATARIVAALLEKDLGQPFNVVNRTGGSGVVGHSAIATAQPDGYTI